MTTRYGDLAGERRRRCMCCWTDLLGFRPSLATGKYTSDEELDAALDRLRFLAEAVTESLMVKRIHLETALVVNDGVARTLDYVVEQGVTSQLQWLITLLQTHNTVNSAELQSGRPGVRAVLVAGERSTYGQGDQTPQSIWRAIDRRDAFDDPSPSFTEEYRRRIMMYSPFEFQLNLAFAKAYLIEAKGANVGLAGPNFYIHDSVFEFLSGLAYQNYMTADGAPSAMSTVVDYDDATVEGHRLVRIGPASNAVQRVRPRRDSPEVEVGAPSLRLLLAHPPTTIDGQPLWRVVEFTPMLNVLLMIPVANAPGLIRRSI